ncbi:unnamed protein product, partial [Discosporangium mesarthrocarpum]
EGKSIYTCNRNVLVNSTVQNCAFFQTFTQGLLSLIGLMALQPPLLGVPQRNDLSTSLDKVDSTGGLTVDSEGTECSYDGSITPRQAYFMCYATDLLSSYDSVKKRGTTGIKVVEELCFMIKARVGLEETYSKGLDKVANQAFKDGLEAGTFKEGLEGLQSDLAKKAMQHRQLARNLTTDVYEPLVELRNQLGQKNRALVSRAGKMQRELRAIDEKYRRSHSKYERCFREVGACVTAAVEGGVAPPIMQGVSLQRGYSSLSLMSEPSPPSRRSGDRSPPVPSSPGRLSLGGSGSGVGGGGTGGFGSGGSGSGSRRRVMSATLDKMREVMPGSNKDIVQWLLPTEQQRKESLVEAAQSAADAAEEARRSCRACWEHLRANIHAYAQ